MRRKRNGGKEKQMLEKQLEAKLRNKIKGLGGRVYKFVSPRQFRSTRQGYSIT